MKSVRGVPVFNECLLNQCCTSAPVPRGICLGKKKNKCFSLFSAFAQEMIWLPKGFRDKSRHDSRCIHLTFLHLSQNYNKQIFNKFTV